MTQRLVVASPSVRRSLPKRFLAGRATGALLLLALQAGGCNLPKPCADNSACASAMCARRAPPLSRGVLPDAESTVDGPVDADRDAWRRRLGRTARACLR